MRLQVKGAHAAKCGSGDAGWRGAQISLHSVASRIGAVGEKMHIEAGERHAAGGVGPVEVATTTSKALRGIIYHNLTIRMLKGLPLTALLKNK